MNKQFLRPVRIGLPTAVAVTGYVEIPDHPRSAGEYKCLGVHLIEADIPLMLIEDRLEDCWLYRYIQESGKTYTHSVADNPQKNSLAYHCVQAQKSEWLVRALDVLPLFGMPSVLVWIDLGIFSLPGMTTAIVTDFMRRAAYEQSVAIPGCWDREFSYDDVNPCWRFCGGVVVMPRDYVAAFDREMKLEYKRGLELTGNVSWEVNVMARLERNHPPFPIRHYYADHSATLFTNY